MVPHPASLDAEALYDTCDVTRTRRSGPGGQNRNKVETAIVLRHRPTGLVAEANERRSQHENRQIALFRLRLMLAIAIRHEPTETPSETWRKYLHGSKVAINPLNEDFPTLVAEALDMLTAHGFEAVPAAERLGCSASQLVKLLKDEPKAFLRLNEAREAAGLHRLR